MKAIIKARNDNGLLVLENLRRLEKIFSKPALRFTLRATLPKKYQRGVLGFKLESVDDYIMFFMSENPIQPHSKSKILEAVNSLIMNCDGSPEDCDVEVVL